MRSLPISVAVLATAGFAFSQQTQQFASLAKYTLPPGGNTWGIDVGDVDGDGDLDIAFARVGANAIYINDGRGKFTDETGSRLPPRFQVNSRAVVLVDMDGDNDLDIVFGNEGQNRLLLNDGQGVFSNRPIPVYRMYTEDCAVGDVDGDNDLDIYWANGGDAGLQQNGLWRNDGNYTFTDVTATNLPPVLDASAGVALADMDGDGDLDVVVANVGTSGLEQNRLYVNDGSGRFTDMTARLPQTPTRSNDVLVEDLDGDGDLDILFMDYLPSWRCQHLRNDGNLTFTDLTANFPNVQNEHEDAAAGDIDGDGDLDLVIGDWIDKNRIYLNDGTGTFTVTPVNRGNPAQASTSGVVLADMDGDQDLDFVVGNYNGDSWIDFNLQRQVHTPLDAQVGQNYDVDFYSHAGFITTPQPVAGLITVLPSPLPPPIVIPPWGSLYIPPGLAVSFPPITISPASGGKFTAPLPLPNDQSLGGLRIYIQAGMIHSNNPSDWRFSNLVLDVIQ